MIHRQRRRRAGARLTNAESANGNPVGGTLDALLTAVRREAIADIPDSLRDELFARYGDVVSNYRNRRWESASLNAAKFAEVVYTILRGRADGAYPPRAAKPSNMVEACRALEKADEVRMGGHGMRITIPRAIPPIYDIRNNRGVGHAGAEIDPAHMDAEFALHTCQWIMAELVRVYHRLSTDTAREVVEVLVQRELPLIWDVGGVRRVLDTTLSTSDKVLVLLYASPCPLTENQLRAWTEYENSARFRNQILQVLHNEVLIHYDRTAQTAQISPLGVLYVERETMSRLNSAALHGATAF